MSQPTNPTVGIIGAGLYGIAIAAHLKFLGIDFRIFGTPMRRWLAQMPVTLLRRHQLSCIIHKARGARRPACHRVP